MKLGVPLGFLSNVIKLLEDPQQYSTTPIDKKAEKAIKAFSVCFAESVKFILPVEGTLLDLDADRSGYGKYMRMPFPIMSGLYTARDNEYIVTWLAIDPLAAWGRDNDDEHIMFFALLHNRVDKNYNTQLTLVKQKLVPDKAGLVKLLPFYGYLVAVDGSEYAETDPEVTKFIDSVYGSAVRSLTDVLLAFNIERGVKYSDLPFTPEVSAKLNKKRAARGKVPLYQYRILDLNADRIVYNHDKTTVHTHASPRAHMRRAHIRHLEDKAVWVRECMVNAGAWEQVDKPIYVGRKAHA